MKKIKIAFTGDLMCNQNMLSNAYIGGAYNFDYLFSGMGEEISGCDYIAGNLEMPVAGQELGYTGERYRFNTPEQYLAALKKAGFDMLTLANNHSMDRDAIGMEKTVLNVEKYGFDHTGINLGKASKGYLVREINGIKVGFINYTYGTNAFHHRLFMPDKSAVNMLQPEETLEGSIDMLQKNEDIERDYKALYNNNSQIYNKTLKGYRQGLEKAYNSALNESDIVIPVLHSGGQYNDQPDYFTKNMFALLARSGAQAIVGHHPHIIQQSAFENGAFCAYSLGNFVFEPEQDKREIDPAYSVVLFLTIQQEKSGETRVGKISFSLYKTVIGENKLPRAVNTYALIKDRKEEKERVLFYADRFAGGLCKFDSPQKEYTYPQGK